MSDLTLIDATTAAERLGLAPCTLRRMAAEGRIPSFKIGDATKAAVRFAEADVAAYLEACRRPAHGEAA